MQWTPGPRTVALGSWQRRAYRRWRWALAVECVALAAQLLVGTAVGLYRQVPADHPGAVRHDPAMGLAGAAWHSLWWAVGHGSPLLRLAVALVAVVVVAAGVGAVQARYAGGGLRLALAWLGLAGAVGAAAAGMDFLTGSDTATDVMLMASGLLVAGVTAVGGLAVARRRR